MIDPENSIMLVEDIISSYHSGKLIFATTQSSTSTNGLVISPQRWPDNGFDTIFVLYTNDTQTRDELLSYLNKGYDFTSKDVRLTCSIHQNRLRDARNNLLNILRMSNPSPYDLEKVISDLGIAINKQLDLDAKIFNQNLKDNIHSKLEVLGLADDIPRLYDKHASLNKFYNATKHGSRTDNREYEDLLKSARCWQRPEIDPGQRLVFDPPLANI